MMWKDQLMAELAMAEESLRAGNAGRARTCARRAVGLAVTEWQRRDPRVSYGADFLRQLQGIAAGETIPKTVRTAAMRLQAKLGTDFQSSSMDPVEDAMIVIRYLLDQMGESPKVS